jgi:predicted phosphoribosyltransferase
VVALPRGGVPVAAEIAKALDAPMDVLAVRKLGVPWYPELAFGAIASDDVLILDQKTVEEWSISEELVEAIITHERDELNRREYLYRGHSLPLDVRGCTVILVDDGVATGATMLAAIEVLVRKNPSRLIIAVPVAPSQTCKALRKRVDDVVTLMEPYQWFDGVGSWYIDFPQVSDEEVCALLNEVASAVAAGVS